MSNLSSITANWFHFYSVIDSVSPELSYYSGATPFVFSKLVRKEPVAFHYCKKYENTAETITHLFRKIGMANPHKSRNGLKGFCVSHQSVIQNNTNMLIHELE
jgi:hypothetical protein